MTKGRLDHAAIASRIPHAGRMCLLHDVVAWDAGSIDCHARSHRDPANPLRSRSQLSAVHGIEYAAQAMAVHGALLAATEEPPRRGYLASVRGVHLHVTHLDDLAGELNITAERLSGDGNPILYQFTVSHGGRCLVEGRAAVILDAEKESSS